jgi:geranylgeranyl pyrophosphate synthase
VRSSGAIERAFEEARSFANQARSSLALFPESSYRQALDQLADFVVFRHL